MALKNQLEMFRNNPLCKDLSFTMVTNIYPTIIKLMTELGIEKVYLDKRIMPSFKNAFIHIDEKILFYQSYETEISSTYVFKNANECPLFSGAGAYSGVNPHESPVARYSEFVRATIACIEPLQKKKQELIKLVEETEKIICPIKRQVFIEKIIIKS